MVYKVKEKLKERCVNFTLICHLQIVYFKVMKCAWFFAIRLQMQNFRFILFEKVERFNMLKDKQIFNKFAIYFITAH